MTHFGFSGFDRMFGVSFGLFGIIFTLFFVGFLVVFLVAAFRGLKTWNRNNHSPRLTVPATILAKRTDVSSHRHSAHEHGRHYATSTSYYVTFQVGSGDRIEFQVQGHEYGVLLEGDRGNLSFQGTRYLGFERT